jgi:two-component sensor histidine kinase/ligand-binding sensor domain-containing protein
MIRQAALGQGSRLSNDQRYTVSKSMLSVEDGLASHEVFCGVQDNAGFLWFGTRNGLNRYDGKNCLLFTHQRQNLQDNKVVKMAKDDANHLFIQYGSIGFKLTTNGKVDVMDATTHVIKSLTAAFPQLPFKEKDVYWLSNDGTDEVNFLTTRPFRLWKYSTKKGFRLRCEMKDWDKPESLAALDYRTTGPFCMFGDGKALLKIFNQSTQYLVTKDTVITFTQNDALRSLPVGFTKQQELLIAYTAASNPDQFEIGTVNRNGNIAFPAKASGFHTDSLKTKYWDQAANATDGKSSMFYMATNGLYLYTDNAFLKVASKSEMKAFESLALYELFPDNLGNLWVCTSLGVMQLKIEKNRFEQYFTVSQQQIETNNQARGIYADETGVMANIWWHTFSQKGGKLSNANMLNGEINYAFVKHGSALYVGGYDLFRYDPVTNKPAVVPGGRGSEIWSMFSLNDSLLLLGRSGGLLMFNSKTSQFDFISYADKNAPEAKFVYRFLKSSDGTVYAVAENGLFKINPPNSRGEQWSIVKINSKTLNGLSLLDAYQDKNGVFWLATNGEGLYRWDQKAGSFRQFNITSGLPSDVLYRIEPGNDGELWISSDYGLIRFNSKTYAVNTYTTIDGISHNEFNRTSSFKAKDGRLFFGGLDGVNAFYPDGFVADTHNINVPLRIIAFNQFVDSKNGLVNKTTELLNTSKITLGPDDKFFTLEFQLLDFAKNTMHRYAYQIGGVDKDWIYINENSLRISGLPYGKFVLHVKAQNREGAWSSSELTIPLVVLKPFYFQWWFILLTVLLLAAAVYALIHLRLKQLAEDKKTLELTVNERTAQLKKSLSEQSDLLVEKDVLMKEIHHRVKNNLQVISGLLELQSKVLNDESAKDALREGRNRVRSIALIHQNLYQFESLSTIDLRRFVTDLFRQIESVFQKQNRVTTNITVPDLLLDIDTAVPLGLIMNELLSNSFKYAFNNDNAGEIDLIIVAVKEGRYQLLYRDNGPGLPIGFDVAKSSTLGMQLIHDLSRQIGGNVKYENQSGAFFTIHFTNREIRKNED